MKKILIIAVVILALAWFFFSGGETDDEYFNSYFNEMVNAGEEKNLDKFMDNFSLHYKDDYGLNYVVVKNVFEKYDQIEGDFSGLSSSLSKDEDGRETVVVNMDASATANNGGIRKGILGLDNSPENITIYLEKSTLGSWQIVRVEGIEGGEY